MGHVNNAAYVDYLEETLLAAGPGGGGASPTASPRRIRLEYLVARHARRRALARHGRRPEPFEGGAAPTRAGRGGCATPTAASCRGPGSTPAPDGPRTGDPPGPARPGTSGP